MKTISLLFIALLLCSCSDSPRAPEIPVKESLSTNSRVIVKRIATFSDRFTPHMEREILIITDKKTGKEYIGISGVGIAETETVFDPAIKGSKLIEE